MNLGRLSIALLLLASCRPAAPTMQATVPPQVALSGVKLRFYRDAELVAQGTADKLVYDRSSSNFRAAQAKLKLPPHGSSSMAREGLALFAPVAEGHLPSKQVEGSGGVELTSSTGLFGQSAKVAFDGNTGFAKGEQPVQVKGTGYQTSAKGFQLDTREERFTFEGDVQSRFGEKP